MPVAPLPTTLTWKVQLPLAGTVAPDMATLVPPAVAAIVPPAHVVLAAGTAATARPDGKVSAKLALVSATVADELLKVTVNTDEPGWMMVDGLNALETVAVPVMLRFAVAAVGLE